MAGLILPGALLALQLGRVQHIGQGAAADVLAARMAGLVVLGAMSMAYLTHASSLIVALYPADHLLRWFQRPVRAAASASARAGRREDVSSMKERARPGGQDRTTRPCH
jgi:hypothetical protein